MYKEVFVAAGLSLSVAACSGNSQEPAFSPLASGVSPEGTDNVPSSLQRDPMCGEDIDALVKEHHARAESCRQGFLTLKDEVGQLNCSNEPQGFEPDLASCTFSLPVCKNMRELHEKANAVRQQCVQAMRLFMHCAPFDARRDGMNNEMNDISTTASVGMDPYPLINFIKKEAEREQCDLSSDEK